MTDIAADIGYVILLVNFIILAKGFSRNGKAFKIFTIYTGAMFCIQISANVMQYLRINNLWLSHFYFILQFVLLSFFYLALFKNDFQKKLVKLGLALGILTLAIQYALDSNLFYKFNLFEIFLTSYLLIIYSAMHFYNLLNSKRQFYYINAGILLYLFGSTILFLTGNLIASLSSEMNQWTWLLNAILYVIYQLLVLWELRTNYAKKKSKSHKL